MAIEKVFFDMFLDLTILVLESTSTVGTRPIRKDFLDFCNSIGGMDSNIAANSVQLEGQSSRSSNRRGQLVNVGNWWNNTCNGCRRSFSWQTCLWLGAPKRTNVPSFLADRNEFSRVLERRWVILILFMYISDVGILIIHLHIITMFSKFSHRKPCKAAIF